MAGGPQGAERKELSPAKAALLGKWLKGKAAPAAPPPGDAITRREGPAPLSFAQQRLWFLHRLDPTSPAYNMYVAHRLRGALDADALQRAISGIVRRHEALRTTFSTGPDGAPVVQVQPPAPVPLPVVDLSHLPEREREAARRARLDEEALAPLDLARGPLLRALLLRLAPDDHELLVVVHHVAFDEWSETVFNRELGALYAACRAGNPSPLAEPPVQYGDFARWQRERLAGDALRAPLARWKARLGGVPPLELPADRPRPPQPTFRGRMAQFVVPAATAEGIRQLARAEGATLHMTLLAAFQTLLHRHAGQDDFAVGSPVSGRDRRETEGLIGFFVNTLPLRADFSGDPTFRELLARTRAACLDAYAATEVPFERLVEEVHPERDPSRSPLFQAFFALQNALTERLEMPGLQVAPDWVHSPTSKFDVSLFVLDEPPTMRCWLETSSDLFDDATAQAFVDRFLVLLQGVARHPDARVSDLPLATEAERRLVLDAWNDTARPVPDAPLHDLVLAQARATPERVAAAFEGERTTYAQLDARSADVAHRIRAAGAGPGSLVAVLLERSLDLPAALLGVLRSGAAYLPLDPSYPPERLAYMLEDSGASVLLTHRGLDRALPPHAARVVDLDAPAAEPTQADAAEPRVAPHDLAYVIYTSGSTGKPKGTMIEHRALVNFLHGMQDLLRLRAEDRWLSVTTPSFDIAALELYLPLLVGATVEIASREATRDPSLLRERLREATLLQATPSTWRMLVDAGWTRDDAPPLKALCGGEALPPALAQALLARADEAWNVYGPTETTVWSTAHRLRPEDAPRVPIGRPIANTRILILDRKGQPTPIGVPGELCIGGLGLARGYLNRPELTAERFVEDPTAPGGRVYRTGDLARWLPDGTLECLGRLDRQVKLRGHRIELGEVEAALAAHPEVRDAAADVRPGPGGEPRLVAWVVPRGADADAPDAAQHIDRWRPVFDARAAATADEDATFDTSVWTSSFTGERIPEEEMHEWIESTVERAQGLQPRRILEIGVGSGLLLWRLAPGCERYVGTDFSGATLARLRRSVRAKGLTNVELVQGEASDLSAIPDGEFDLVLVNSVAQYFPDAEHLVRVATAAAAKLRAGRGAILLGDLRSLPLLDAFHQAVEDARAQAEGDASTPEERRRRAERRAADEEELILHPALADALAARVPGVAHARALLRDGRADNEMNRYRYDIILHVGEAPPLAPAASWRDWTGEGLTIDALRLLIERERPASLGLLRVPNGRLTPSGVDPAALGDLALSLGYELETSWASARPDGAFDAALRRDGALTSDFPRAATPDRFANEPARTRARREREAALVARVREHLQRVLPEPMLPSALAPLSALPLTPNGKVDRKALPDPDAEAAAAAAAGAAYVAPRTDAERALARVWGALLGAPRVGAHDGFFALGGHSLLATQMVSRVRAELGVEIPLRQVFATPTLEALARAVEQAQAGPAPADDEPPLAPLPERRRLPLSSGQERLWFLHQLDPTSPAYNMALARRLRGPLDAAALERALGDLAARHESLRTLVALDEGVPAQDVRPPAPVPLPVVDAASEEEALRIVTDAAHAPFDLVMGPVFRALLVRLAPGDHVLLLGMHHLAFDEWSERVLLRDLADLYAVRVQGGAPALPPPRLQFGDAAAWLAKREAMPAAAQRVARWKKRLQGVEPLDLPTDRPRPPAPRFRGASARVPLAPRVARALRDLARAEGATGFMATAAILQEFLRRHAGQDDVALAAPVAGRPRAELEDVVGFFVNTIVLRGDLSGDPSLRALLRRARDACLDAYADQDAPLERVVDALGAPRDLARPPLAQVGLVMQQPPTPLLLPGVACDAIPIESRVARFDLTLWASETDAHEMTLEADADLFDAATVERLAARLAALVEAAVARPDAPLSQVDALPEPERRLVAEAWTGATAPYPSDEGVHALFEAQARRAPERVALVDAEPDGSVTYARLDARADALAHALRQAGIAGGDLVALCLPRGVDAIAATLAVLKAGGAYVPLDPEWPAERVASLLRDAGVRVALATRATVDKLPQEGVRALLVEDAPDAPPADARPSARVRGDAPAYVMFTSGSTGTPKGVLVPHRAIARLVHAQDYVRFGPDEVFLHHAPAAFDASTFEVWGALLHGARVVLAPPRRLAAHDLAALLRQHDVTTLWLTAPLFHLVVDEDVDALSGVRQLIAGGDALSVPHVRRALERLPATCLVNGYGPTECTTFACCHAIAALAPDARSVPIGRPIANTRALVLDASRRPCPVGVPGELHLGGDGLALGYLHRPDLTAERFVEDPLAPGERLYRTGDKVRWLPDGTLEFLGRLDDQVKIRGYRVEPGEVEAVLAAHPHVGACAVLARPDPAGGKRLVAYAAPAPGAALDADALGAHLRQRLPEHLVPAALVALPALPLNANGKIDRKALPDPQIAAKPAAAYVPPRGPTEERLAALWADVLRAPRVGAMDDFFALGGNSLLATRLVSRVRQAFGIDLPLPVIFHAPTLEAFAREVEDARARGVVTLPPLAPRPADAGPAPLSPGQERLWFLHKWNPESASYNNGGAFRIQGPLDPDALSKALDFVITRHEVLRTVFPAPDGRPEARVLPHEPLRLAVQDVADLAEAQRHADANAAAPFDLERGPLHRFRLLRLAPDDHLLIVAFHHTVFDGWSIGVIMRELREGYAAAREGRAPALPPLPIQYADFAAWQRAYSAKGGPLDARVEAWRKRLEGLAPLDLPTDRPRPQSPRMVGRTVRFRLPRRVADAARALAHAEGATEFMTLLAAFQTLLHRHAGVTDVAVGTPVSGRRAAETEDLVGFFPNTLVLRTDLAGAPTFRELLARTRATCLDAFGDQDVPLERIMEAVQPPRDGRPPLVQVMFALQQTHDLAFAPDLRVEEIPCETGSVKLDVALYLHDRPEGIDAAMEYDGDLFDEATAVRMAHRYGALLESAVAFPDRRIDELPLLPADEAERLAAWATPREMPLPERCLHDLVAEQARRTPDRLAVAFEDERMTYAQLDARAAQIARRLRAEGAGPGARVAVLLERSLDLPAALLGVLRAGAAYVPLDPAYPPSRLAFMLQDSGAKLLLTHRGLHQDLPALAALVVDLDATAPPRGEANDVEAKVAPGDLAYVIYTSGSTGKPKGTMIEHRALVNLLQGMQELLKLRAEDRWLSVTTPSFDIAALELYLPLLVGATVEVASREATRDPKLLIERLRGATVLQATPSTWRLLVDAGWTREDAPGLKALCGGEALPPALAQDLLQRAAEAWNVYGPTETTVWSTAHRLRPEDARRVPIGRPLQNTRVLVLDARGQPTPVGVPGELCIGGMGLARGYLNRPELTAERFAPDPQLPGERVYSTGDLARWLPDGTLECLGRLDDQVKIRGHRIEPGEIAAVLRALPGVRDAHVLARADDGQPRLVAYVVGEADPLALRDALRERLPEHMVPAHFVRLDAIPLTPNGKVDRKALPAPDAAHALPSDAFVAPRDDAEARLAAVWRDVLGVPRVGVHDRFFDLGGHSLLVPRVVARVRADLGVDLPLSAIFEAPTLEGLAKRVRALAPAAAAAADAPAKPGDAPRGGIRRASREAYRVPREGGA